MPIDLHKIPQKMKAPEAPSLIRWSIFVVLITLMGVMLALWLWPQRMSTHTPWFWFCTLAIPLSIGFACYAVRLHRYENERDKISYWNSLHQQQYDRQVEIGQRAAGLLGKSFITPYGCNRLATALLNHGSLLQSQYFPHLQRALTFARLPHWTPEHTYEKRLAGYLNDVLHMLEPEFSSLHSGKVSVRIQHDGALNNMQIEQIWLDSLPRDHFFNAPEINAEDAGLMWLDSWLDQRESAVMLSIEVNLFHEPRNLQAESVSALLLASPEWLSQHNVKPDVLIHRPVAQREQGRTMEDLFRWGKLSADEPHTLWQTQVSQASLLILTQQAAGLSYFPGNDENYILDDLFGKPGAALGNIALICASEYTVTSGKPQWIMAESKTIQQVIVRQFKT